MIDPETFPPSPLMAILARIRRPELPALVAAHRGDSQNAPENTLSAFGLAIENGADLIEFDVQQSASGDVMVIHDGKVDRTTNGHGEVHKLPTEAIREFSAGEWFAPRFADERVPLLDEVLDLCKGHAVPLIEIKAKRRTSNDLGKRVVAALRRHNMLEEAAVICRELARVEEVHSAAKQTPICYLTLTKRQALGATRLTGVRGVDCYWKSLSLGLVEQLRRASVFITPWTVNRPRDMERLLLIGVESIITDAPVMLRDQIERFEFQRTRELRERYRRGDLDLDLDTDEPRNSKEAAKRYASDSEFDVEVDWPEDPW
ncbi:glycerophosphodiester phosphodiesterase family protein [Planctomycetota bacterium]|nr:glycerophosphodiester phosphodiesterase family protein [Planctomycetota bacterium]